MQQAYLNINGVPTKIMTWGKWVEESFRANERKEVVLCIPGNPGVTRFYSMFLQTIHEQVGIPVWVVGHAGHENPNNSDLYHMPPFKNNERLYNLQGQVDHKVAFIKKYVPKDVNLYLIGHSIGAHIILNLLKTPEIKARVTSSYLLFPTIECMAESRNGRVVMKYLRHFIFLLLYFAWFFMLLPIIIQKFLVCLFCRFVCIPKMHYQTVRMLIDPYVLNIVCQMALDEIHSVQERDNAVLRDNKDRIRLYYGATDHWVPAYCCENLKKTIPSINAEICVRGFPHAFVLRDSRQVGNMVANWIKEN